MEAAKDSFGAGVIAGAIEDVAGHVDHVAGGGSEAAEDFGAVQGLLRVRTGFDGVNPVVIRGGIFRVFLQNGLQNRKSFFLAGVRVAVIVVAIAQRPPPGKCAPAGRWDTA